MELVLASAGSKDMGAGEEVACAIVLPTNGVPLRNLLIRRVDVIFSHAAAAASKICGRLTRKSSRAPLQSMFPVVSAGGHEIDFTISDFVADFRAATPTAGAEIITKVTLRAGVLSQCPDRLRDAAAAQDARQAKE